MAVSKKDIILIPISDEMDCAATYFAKKREMFEFPRSGYGDYATRGFNKIKTGILGELAFLEYIHTYIDSKYGDIDPYSRYNVLKDIGFSYQTIVGKTDGGFEFKLSEKLVDVKTYETNQVSINQIFNGLKENGCPLNLLIDKSQNPNADIYIQAFITKTSAVCLAGFNIGLPDINYNFPKPAHACSIKNLSPIREITFFLNEN